MVLLVASFVHAVTDTTEDITFGIYKKGETIRLFQGGTNGSQQLSFCNISVILYPNSTPTIMNQIMEPFNTIFSFNVTPQYTQVFGKYDVLGFCGTASQIRSWNYNFYVTPDGTMIDTGQAIIFFILLILAYTLAFVTLNFSLKMKLSNKTNEYNEIIEITKEKYWKIISVCACYLLFMFAFLLTAHIAASYLWIEFISVTFRMLYLIMLYGLAPIVAFALLFAVIFFLRDENFKNIDSSLKETKKVNI